MNSILFTPRQQQWLPTAQVDRWVGVFALTLLLMLLFTSPAYAETFIINSTGDDADIQPGDGICATIGGQCTLRAAIAEANASLDVTDFIHFNIPNAGLQSIHLSTALPVISDTVTIDGLTQPGAACTAPLAPANLLIELNGSGTTTMTNGLELAGSSAGSTIRGLIINEFGGNGVRIASDHNRVVCNHVGVDATGTIARGNGGNGILINNASDNVIGGLAPAERNVIAGNGANGVLILTGDEIVEEEGTSDPHLVTVAPASVGAVDEEVTIVTPALRNQVIGNYIGINSAGTVALGNTLNGVQIAGSGVDAQGDTVYSSFNLIGTVNGRNVIAGNLANGVALVEAAMTNTVSSNYIGVNALGKGPLANTLVGVLLENAADNIVEQNLIAGNGGNGAHIADPPSSINSTGNVLRGNRIGLNAAGDKAIPNGGAGVGLQNASFNLVGGPAESDRNVIAGNVGDGIIVQRSLNFRALQNRIENNYIGINAAATVAIGNGGAGVHLFNAEVTTVHRNVIGGNGAGITFGAPETYGNIVTANILGTDPTQSYVFGNGEHGIFINSNAHDNRIGGVNPGEGNTIAFHSGRGIWMTSTGSFGNAIRGNSIHDNQGTEIENKLGIDLTGSGPNPNDLTDIDIGPNMLQNYPDLVGVYNFSGSTFVNALLNSTPNSDFAIDFFYNRACDPSGYGEGEFYMESITVTTDATGYVGFSHQMRAPAAGRLASMTATDSKGNTSEFSLCAAPVDAYIVNSTDDTDDSVCDRTHCTLREAINVANAAADKSTIVFGIAGKGPHVIAPTSELPLLRYPTVVDGTAQPGAVCPADSLRPAPLEPIDPAADLALLLSYYVLDKPPESVEHDEPIVITPTLQIILNGSQIGTASSDGLTVAGGDSTVTGLTIQRFTGNGLVLTALGNNQVTCNLIGTDAEGLVMQGNGENGILVDNVAGNVIGESQTATAKSRRNIVAANGQNGLLIRGTAALDNQVAGNFIGLNATGRVDFGNAGNGIAIDSANHTLIGGADPEARMRNVIAGNGQTGIAVNDATVLIDGNFVGVDMAGTSPVGNDGAGLHLLNVSNSRIETNLISANGSAGIRMDGGTANLLQGNLVGSDLWRVGWLGNHAHGMALVGVKVTQIISNGIAYNDGAGISIVDAESLAATGVWVQWNAIHDNDLLGIDLAGNNITLNDPADTDTGPNNLQNFPVLVQFVSDGISTLIAGTLDTAGNAPYRLQFFADVYCDPLGNGEGRVLLGELPVMTDGTGHADFVYSIPVALPNALVVTANATDSEGNTSEFSACSTPFVPAPAVDLALTSSPTGGKPGDQLHALLTVVNQGNIADSFVISIDSNWPAEASNTVVGPLPPGIGSQFTVTLTVPEDAPVGEINHTTVTATSSFNESFTDNATFTTVVEQPPGFGDCNNDGAVDAGDLSALVLEFFDGDGSDPTAAAGGSFAGGPSCDANGDSTIDAGDLSCTVLIIFNGPGACGVATGSADQAPTGATLAVANQQPVVTGVPVALPVMLQSDGQDIQAAVFTVTFDPDVLMLDPTDGDGDGTPDAVALTLAAGQVGSAVYRADEGRVEIAIFGTTPNSPPLAYGTLATLTLTANAGVSGEQPITLTAGSFGNATGKSVPVSLQAGSVVITTVPLENRLYLPFVNR